MDSYLPEIFFIMVTNLCIKSVDNWEAIKAWKINTGQKDNSNKNYKQLWHPYWVRDKVLIINV